MIQLTKEEKEVWIRFAESDLRHGRGWSETIAKNADELVGMLRERTTGYQKTLDYVDVWQDCVAAARAFVECPGSLELEEQLRERLLAAETARTKLRD